MDYSRGDDDVDDDVREVEFLEEEIQATTPKLSSVPSAAKRKLKPAPIKGKNVHKTFTTGQKLQLASLVREKLAIWKLENKLHHNSHAVAAAWNYVAKEMDETTEDCKAVWKSLKNSMRYHTRVKHTKKSGSPVDSDVFDNLDQPIINEDTVAWEFTDCMSFLEPSTRETWTTRLVSNTPTEILEGAETSGESGSNYSYSTQRSKANKFKDALATTASNISENIAELLNLRKQISSVPAQPPLKYMTMMANLDRMLQKFPEEKVEELNMIFTRLIFEQIQNQRN